MNNREQVSDEEMIHNWFNQMYKDEIEKVEGMMANEQLIAKGCNTEGMCLMHLQNIATMSDYVKRLEKLCSESAITEQKTYAEQHFEEAQSISYTVDIVISEYDMVAVEPETVEFIPLVPINADMRKTFSTPIAEQIVVYAAVRRNRDAGLSCNNILSLLGKVYERAIQVADHGDFVAFDIKLGDLKTVSIIEPCLDFKTHEGCVSSSTKRSLTMLAYQKIPTFSAKVTELLDELDQTDDDLIGFAFHKI